MAIGQRKKGELSRIFENLEGIWQEYEVYERLKHKVLVVGGGAAGMMAAGAAAEAGAQVILLEPNDRLTRDLVYITGKGRCNVTNDCGVDQVLKEVPRNGRFLYSCLEAFPPRAAMDFFEAQGCPLKVERGNRVFPVSDNTRSSVVRALGAVSPGRQGGGPPGAGRGPGGGGGPGHRRPDQPWAALRQPGHRGHRRLLLSADRLHRRRLWLARSAGHTVTELRGSLVPLEEDGGWCAKLQGLSLRNCAIQAKNAAGKVLYKDFGELLFTHFGLSGPVILSASAHGKPGS